MRRVSIEVRDGAAGEGMWTGPADTAGALWVISQCSCIPSGMLQRGRAPVEREVPMTTARDIMTPNPECIHRDDTLVVAAQRMRDANIGSLPICGEDEKLIGVLTDRDIVVKVIAEGATPDSTTAGELAQGEVVTIGADDDISEALRVMTDHAVRRLPVIDGTDLVGIIAQADVARALGDEEIARVLRGISA